jgi:hypothetical protein
VERERLCVAALQYARRPEAAAPQAAPTPPVLDQNRRQA